MNGPIAKYLVLDKKSGIISLGNYSVFDREKVDIHFLTVEARDDLGRGNRNTVELLIHLTDVNDNAPKFEKEFYEISVDESLPKDSQILPLNALDVDAGRNGRLTYTIIESDAWAADYLGNPPSQDPHL